jgi:flagellar hook-length control protein FliK
MQAAQEQPPARGPSAGDHDTDGAAFADLVGQLSGEACALADAPGTPAASSSERALSLEREAAAEAADWQLTDLPVRPGDAPHTPSASVVGAVPAETLQPSGLAPPSDRPIPQEAIAGQSPLPGHGHNAANPQHPPRAAARPAGTSGTQEALPAGEQPDAGKPSTEGSSLSQTDADDGATPRPGTEDLRRIPWLIEQYGAPGSQRGAGVHEGLVERATSSAADAPRSLPGPPAPAGQEESGQAPAQPGPARQSGGSTPFDGADPARRNLGDAHVRQARPDRGTSNPGPASLTSVPIRAGVEAGNASAGGERPDDSGTPPRSSGDLPGGPGTIAPVVPAPVVPALAATTPTVLSAPAIVAEPGPRWAVEQPEAATSNRATPTTLPDDLPDQMVKAIQLQWRGGVGEARLRLRPEHLGDITVSLRVERGVVTAVMRAESAAVHDWIQVHRHELQAALAEQGLHLERLRIATDPNGRRQADAEQRQDEDRPSKERRPAGELPAFEVRV